MNYSTQVDVPTAHITRKKSRLKIYNDYKIFLNDGDNFEFELHNPKTKPVLVKIKLNGNYISSSGVVLNPGQRVYLERFLDTNNKFKFSTYDVEDTPKNKSAIKLNGDIGIEFYDQQDFITFPHLNRGSWSPGWNTIITNTPTYNNHTYTSSSGTITNSNNTFTTTSVNYSNSPNIETGRIEKGKSSKQEFEFSNENFSSAVSKQYHFKILPYNQKNKMVNEIRQYCTECGTKVKNSYKFCPSCGNKI